VKKMEYMLDDQNIVRVSVDSMGYRENAPGVVIP
jgi:hypothetical protein